MNVLPHGPKPVSGNRATKQSVVKTQHEKENLFYIDYTKQFIE